jgi:hypothetical protein
VAELRQVVIRHAAHSGNGTGEVSQHEHITGNYWFGELLPIVHNGNLAQFGWRLLAKEDEHSSFQHLGDHRANLQDVARVFGASRQLCARVCTRRRVRERIAI